MGNFIFFQLFSGHFEALSITLQVSLDEISADSLDCVKRDEVFKDLDSPTFVESLCFVFKSRKSNFTPTEQIA